MPTGNIAMELGAVLTLDDHDFNERMEAKPAQAERSLGEVASIADRNLGEVGSSAQRARQTIERGFNEARDSASRNFQRMRDSARESFTDISNLAMRFLSFGALAGTGAKVFGKFFIQEDAVEGLRASLHNLGRASTEAMGRYQQFASELQKKTRYGDETVLAAMTQGIRLGIDPKQIEEVTEASVGLAAKLGVDLHTAMMLVSRASQGNTAMLSRYGLKLDETKSKAEQFQDVLKFGKSGFSLAEDAAKTSAGAMEQMKNAIGDTMEEIGKALSEYLIPTVNVIKDVATWFNNLGDTTKRLVVGLGSAAAGMAALRLSVGGVFSMATKLVPMLLGMGTAAAGAGVAAGSAASGFTAFWAAAAGPIAAVVAGIVAIRTVAKSMENDIDELVENARNAQQVAQEMRTKMQGENSERTAAIKRLQEISRIGHLNNATQDEANRLIEKYGFKMKVVNGQLVNMGESFDMLIKKQEELARKQLEFSYRKEIVALESQIDIVDQKTRGVWEAFKRGLMLPFGGTPENDKRLKKLREQLSELEKATEDALGGGKQESASENTGKEAQKALRPALKALKELWEQNMTAKFNAAELLSSLTRQRNELANQVTQGKELNDLTDEEIEKLAKVSEIDQKIYNLRKESADYIKQARVNLSEYTREQKLSSESRQFDKEFDRRLSGAKTKEDDQRILEITNRRVEVAKRKAQNALDWYNRQLEIANDDKIITDMEKEQLDRRLQNLKDADALVEKETERREKAVEAIENRAAKRQEERNRRRASSMQRQAAEITRKLKMLGADNIDRSGITFDRNGRYRGNVSPASLAKLRRERASIAETLVKIQAQDAGQKFYIDDRGRQRRVHLNREDRRNMEKIDRMESERKRLEDKAKDYTKPIEDVRKAIELLGKDAMVVKR